MRSIYCQLKHTGRNLQPYTHNTSHFHRLTRLRPYHLAMPSPIHLILDWDGTLTSSSTLPLIAQIGYDLNASSTQPRSLPSWDSISDAYMADSRAHNAAYTPCAVDRDTVESELAWLESLKDIERESMERVEAAGIFIGVGKEDVRRAAKRAMEEGKVTLRDGWDRLVQAAFQEGGQVAVVSVGWSGEFIRECLQAAMKNLNAIQKEQARENIDLDGIDVRANEVLGGKAGRMNRYFEEGGRKAKGGIWTARNKRKVVDDVVSAERDNVSRRLVCVGDSVTDLECLLSADVGVCIRDPDGMISEQKQLDESLQRLRIGCRWIGDMMLNDLAANLSEKQTTSKPSLWWARDLAEICHSPLVCDSQSTVNENINNLKNTQKILSKSE